MVTYHLYVQYSCKNMSNVSAIILKLGSLYLRVLVLHNMTFLIRNLKIYDNSINIFIVGTFCDHGFKVDCRNILVSTDGNPILTLPTFVILILIQTLELCNALIE